MTTFRTARPEDTPALRSLWHTVFPDADHVVPLYEQDRGRAARTFLACDGETPVAVVYWLPRPIRDLTGAARRVGCVSSVATLPRARGQGLVRHLLTLATTSMTAAGCAWSLLFTATPAVYPNWTVFDRVTVHGTFARPSPQPGWTTREASLSEWPVLAGLYTRHNAARPLTTSRTCDDWTTRVPVWYAEHQILLASHHDTPTAYAIIHWPTATVTEYAAPTDADAAALFTAVARAASDRQVTAGRLLAPPPSTIGELFTTWTTAHDHTGLARPLTAGATEVRSIVEAPTAVHWTADYF